MFAYRPRHCNHDSKSPKSFPPLFRVWVPPGVVPNIGPDFANLNCKYRQIGWICNGPPCTISRCCMACSVTEYICLALLYGRYHGSPQNGSFRDGLGENFLTKWDMRLPANCPRQGMAYRSLYFTIIISPTKKAFPIFFNNYTANTFLKVL
jgi:hypothetical protein